MHIQLVFEVFPLNFWSSPPGFWFRCARGGYLAGGSRLRSCGVTTAELRFRFRDVLVISPLATAHLGEGRRKGKGDVGNPYLLII